MAKDAINGSVVAGSPYTCPPGKQAVVKCFMSGGSSAAVMVNGVVVAQVMFGTSFGKDAGPIVLNAGDVLSAASGGVYGFSGFLYGV